MKLNSKKLGFLLSAGCILALSSCKKDEETAVVEAKDLTATEASAEIDSNSDELANTFSELTSLESSNDIAAVLKQYSNSTVSYRKSGSNLKKAFEAEPLKAYYGKKITLSETNADLETGAQESINSNDVVIVIPANTEHPVVEVRIKSLVLTQRKTTTETYDPNTFEYVTESVMEEVPEKLSATLSIANKVVSTVNFTSVWNNIEESYPTTLDFSVTLEDFAIKLNHTESGLKNTVDFNFNKKGSTIVGLGASVDFANSTRDEESVKAVSSYIQLANLKMSAAIPDAQAAQNISENATAKDYNALFDMKMTKANNGAKIASLQAFDATDGSGTIKAGFVYNDGSIKDAETVFTDLADKLEANADAYVSKF